MPGSTVAKSAEVTLNPKNQKLESINTLVASIIGRTGCMGCGRLLKLSFQFAVDPGDLEKEGAISVETVGI